MQIGRALALSGDPADRDLARAIASFVKDLPTAQRLAEPSQAIETAPPRQPTDIARGR